MMKSPLTNVLLILNADGFSVPLVVVAQSAIDADIVCFVCHFFYLPALCIHTLCGSWLSPDFSDAVILQRK